MTLIHRTLDMDDLPPGTHVKTPSGRAGVVIKHRGAESKQDHYMRVIVRYFDEARETVALQPQLLQLLKKNPPAPRPRKTICRCFP